MTRHLAQSHDELIAVAGRQGRTVTLCTGRTLARTIVADWLVRLQPYLADGELRISTRSLADAVHDLQHSLADFSILYHHPSLVVPLDGREYEHVALATNRLLPYSPPMPAGHPCTCWKPAARPCPTSPTTSPPLRWGAWWKTCWLARPLAAHLKRLVECDSPDANYEYVRKGLGVSWLPWSVVHADVKSGLLAPAGGRGWR